MMLNLYNDVWTVLKENDAYVQEIILCNQLQEDV